MSGKPNPFQYTASADDQFGSMLLAAVTAVGWLLNAAAMGTLCIAPLFFTLPTIAYFSISHGYPTNLLADLWFGFSLIVGCCMTVIFAANAVCLCLRRWLERRIDVCGTGEVA